MAAAESGWRRCMPAVAVIAALAALYLPWMWSDQLASLGGDSAVYVLSARHYAPFLPQNPVWEAVTANSPYPPLYPLLLMLAGGATDLHWAHLATTCSLLAAVIALLAWLRASGVRAGPAIAAGALFALLPGTLLQAFHLHSESLYLAFSLAALASLARLETDARARWFWLAGAFVAAALMTRTAGVALVPALLLAWYRHRRWHGGGALALALAPTMLWQAFQGPGQGYQSSLLGGYLTMSPAQLLDALALQATAILDGVVTNFVKIPGLDGVMAAAAGLALVVAAARLWRLRPDAAYVWAYLGLVVIWPYPGEAVRFAWVLVPLLLGYLVLGAGAAGARLVAAGGRWGGALPWALVLVLAVPTSASFALALQRALHPVTGQVPGLRHLPQWYGVDFERSLAAGQFHLAVDRAVREMGAQVPESECIFAIKTPIVAFHAGRLSKSPPPFSTDEAAFEAQLRDDGCRYFLLLGLASPSYPQPYYPAARLGERLEPLESRILKLNGREVVVAALARLHPAGRAP